MCRFNKYFTFLVCFMVFATSVYSQEVEPIGDDEKEWYCFGPINHTYNSELTLQQIQRNNCVTARDYVKFTTGFKVSSYQDGVQFKAGIDETLTNNSLNYASGEIINRPLDYDKAIGSLPGSFAVGRTGAATYTIPIEVAPGTAGLQPQLSISYNSQAGNGSMGIGWNLSGISVIARVPQNMYYDNRVQGIEFSPDKHPNSNYNFAYYSSLAIDGNRLLKIDASEEVYTTENDNYMRIVPTAGSGGIGFKVYTKDGSVIEYGLTSDSRIEAPGFPNEVLLYYVNKITDANGNYMQFYYYEDNVTGESWPLRIEYSGNTASGMAPYNAVRFIYESRGGGSLADNGFAYTDGAKTQQKMLLKEIRISGNSRQYRKYEMNYVKDFYTHLSEIKIFGTDNSTYNSTFINWGETNATIGNNLPVSNFNTKINEFFGDYNGDGLADAVSYGDGSWQFYKNTGDGTNDAIDFQYVNEGSLPNFYIHPNFGNYAQNMAYGHYQLSDFDGDGKSDFMVCEKDYHGQTVCNGTSLSNYHYTYKQLSYNGSGLSEYYLAAVSTYENNTPYEVIGDFNGDGESDLLVYMLNECYNNQMQSYHWRLFMNNTVYPSSNFLIKGWVRPIDYNGNGKTDLLFYNTDNGRQRWEIYELSMYNSWNIIAHVPTNLCGSNDKLYPGDFNGDGKTDLLVYHKSGNSWNIIYSTGKSSSNWFVSSIAPNITPANPDDFEQLLTSDFNGDGKEDVCVIVKRDSTHTIHHPHGGVTYEKYKIYKARFYYSPNGLNFLTESRDIAILNGDIDYGNNRVYNYLQVQCGDFNGDGRIDLFHTGVKQTITLDNNGNVTSNTSTSLCKTIFEFRPREQKHLVQKITDGVNNHTNITHTYLTNKNILVSETPPGGPFTSPKFALSVVSAYNKPNTFDITGRTDNWFYMKYYDAVIHRAGKGFLGFKKMCEYNLRANVSSVKYIDIVRPDGSTDYSVFTAAPIKNETYSGDYRSSAATLLSRNTSTYKLIKTYPGTTYNNAKKAFFMYPATLKNEDALTSFSQQTDNENPDSYGNIQLSTQKFFDASNQLVAKVNNNTVYENVAFNGHIFSRISSQTTTQERGSNPQHQRTTQYFYDGSIPCRLTDVVSDPYHPFAATTHYSNFTAFGQPQMVTNTAGGISRSKQSIFDASGRFVIRQINDLQQEVINDYDLYTGYLIRSTDINNLATSYQYDGFGNRTLTIFPDNVQHKTTVAWNNNNPQAPAGAFYSITEEVSGQAPAVVWNNRAGKKLLSVTKGLNNETIFNKVEYNLDGTVLKESLPYFETETPRWIDFTYDYLFRPLTQIGPGINVSTTYSGSTITTTDNLLNQTTSKTTDATGLTISSTDAGGTITYDYYSDGNAKSINYGNVIITMKYNLFGNQTELNDPNAGIMRYYYNAFGEMTSQIYPDGRKDSLRYDVLGRVQALLEPENCVTTYAYDTRQNGKGKLATVAGPNVTEHFYYDALGRNYRTVQSFEGNDYVFEKEFDAYGRVRYDKFPSLFNVENMYNSAGYLKKIKIGNEMILWEDVSRNALGMPLQYKTFNNINTTFTYDAYNRPDVLQAGTTAAPGSVLHWDFDFNEAGQLLARKDVRINKTETFEYDPLNRLKKATIGANNISISYNINGNITQKTDAGTYLYESAKPHAVTALDNPHTLVPQRNQRISYNSFQKVYTIAENGDSAVFTYGNDKQRVKMKLYRNNVLQITKLYFGSYEKEINHITGITRELHYVATGNGSIVLFEKKSNGMNRLLVVHSDYLGNILAVTDFDGNVAERNSFDAWGNRRNPDTWVRYNGDAPALLLGRGYTGHEHLDQFALINMNGRLYDPTVGRFLSPDNLLHGGTQGINRYSYALNNPLLYTDPDGECPILVGILIGAALGAYSGYKIGEAAGAKGWKMAGYIAGGALIGGLSGYVGASITAGGGFMANTLGTMSSSFMNSTGMAMLSGGAMQPSISFGVASYNFGTNEWGYLGKKGNKWYEDMGYAFGAMANLQDVVAGMNGIQVDVKSRKEVFGHSEFTGTYENEKDVLVSIGPKYRINQNTGREYYLKDGEKLVIPNESNISSAKWESQFVKQTLKGNSALGKNKALIESNPLLTKVNNVNGKLLVNYTKHLNEGRNLLNTGVLKYGLFNGCVNYTSRALLYSGVVNFNAILPVTAPVLLNTELVIRQMGMYSSAYLNNY